MLLSCPQFKKKFFAFALLVVEQTQVRVLFRSLVALCGKSVLFNANAWPLYFPSSWKMVHIFHHYASGRSLYSWNAPASVHVRFKRKVSREQEFIVFSTCAPAGAFHEERLYRTRVYLFAIGRFFFRHSFLLRSAKNCSTALISAFYEHL